MSNNEQEGPNQWETPLLAANKKSNQVRKCGYCNQFGHNRRTCPSLINNGEFFVKKLAMTSLNDQSSKTATAQPYFFCLDTINNNTTTPNQSLESVGRNIFNNNIASNVSPINGTEARVSGTQPDENLHPSSDDDSSVQPDRAYLLTTLYVVFDIETTGLSKIRNDIIEIAAQMLDPIGDKLGESFSSLVNPFRRLPPFITTLTGITDGDLYGKPTFSIIGFDLFQYINTSIRQYEQDNNTENLV